MECERGGGGVSHQRVTAPLTSHHHFVDGQINENGDYDGFES